MVQITAKVLSALALWVITLSAQSAPTESVTIGAYINGIRSIDLKAGSAEIDLYLWLRSSSERNLLDSIEIMNGNGSEKTAVVHKANRGENYQSARLQLSTYQIFNLKKFPLDNQVLRIVIEDFEADISSLQFIADSENTKVSKSIVLPGWKIGDAHIKIEQFSYETNYGDTSLGESNSVFSRAVIEIPIEREGIGYFFKLFGTVVLSAAVAFLSFHVKPSDLDPRFGLGIGGIFAVVASNFVLSSMLPETHEVTMGEALLLLTIAGIFIALLESVISLKLWERGKEMESSRLDHTAGIWIPALYLLAFSGIIAVYYTFPD